ncbi:MAG TPA: hypothetical protein VK604_05110 [Bryobacteraceae bacterium]|nr:hypothetical protein [Bryobacteraceae bacterium]
MSCLIIAFVFVACFGCAVRQPGFRIWQLVRQDAAHVLIPPDITAPDIGVRTFTTDIAGGCRTVPSAAGVIAIETHGKHARVTVTRDSLAQQPTGWLGAWASQVEASGCFPPGDGMTLAIRIAESVPLEPGAAVRLLYSDERETGAVDIGPHTRLQVVSPIWRKQGVGLMADGPYTVTAGGDYSLNVTGNSTDNLLGYERALYAVVPKTRRVGCAIIPRYADLHIQGKTKRRQLPIRNAFPFPPETAFYRIFHKMEDDGFTVYVLAARTVAELDKGTEELRARGNSASCDVVERAMCIAIPKDVAVIPLISVTVNGTEVLLSRGGTLSQAIYRSGEHQSKAVPPDLTIRKPWNGRLIDVMFDHADAAILNLSLRGGEMISWKCE